MIPKYVMSNRRTHVRQSKNCSKSLSYRVPTTLLDALTVKERGATQCEVSYESDSVDDFSSFFKPASPLAEFIGYVEMATVVC